MDIYLASTNKIGPHHTYNDWLSYENATNDEQIATMLSVSYYAWDARLMSVMANALGLKDEQAKYQRVYEEEKEYFIKNFVNSDGSLNRGEQTVCLYALYLDLLPSPTSVERVTEQLITNLESKGNKLQTGFLGTEIILTTLSKIGRTDMAYRILLQHDCPSWLYSVDQGATTIWERWNSYTVMDGFIDADPVSGDLMNSFNHYSYGSASAWIFNTMAGINYSESSPGFKEIVLAPQIDQAIKKVEASYESSYGTIISNYEVANGTLTYDCKIPCNTTASIKLEIEDINSLKINGKSYNQCTLENDGVEFLTDYRGTVIFNAVSGSYKFTSDIEELNVLSMKTMTGDVALGDLITKVNDTYVSVSSYVKMHEGDVVSISLKNSSLIEKYQWVDENQNPISSNAELINYKINKDSLIYLVRK